MTQIKSITELKKLATNGLDCYIRLNGGIKSSKHIWFDDSSEQFEIINLVDGSEQCLREEQLYTSSNIGEALDKGALYKD